MNVQFTAKGSQGEVWLYDQIGQSFWGDGISAKSFQKELSALGKVTSITVRINSPGGDVFDGFAIYNQLKSHPAKVVVDVDGLAASIASVIAMAGDEIRVASNAMIMIHNPHGMAVGDADEMLRVAALLEQVKGSLADTYAGRTKQPLDKLKAWMDDETWMAADTAVQYGFADGVTNEQPVSACWRLDPYKKVPEQLRARAVAQMFAARDVAAVRIAQQAETLKRMAA